MPVDLFSVSVLVLSWGATYLLHSTLLIAGVWIFLKFRRDAGHALREIVWKTALVGGLATASGQLLLLPAGPLGRLTWMLPSHVSYAGDPVVGERAQSEDIMENGFLVSAEEIVTRRDSAGEEHEIWMMAPSSVASDVPDRFLSSNAADLPGATEHAASAPAATGVAALIAPVGPGLAAVVLSLLAIAIGLLRSLWQTLALSKKLAACTRLDEGLARELLDELCRLVPRAPPVRLLVAAGDAEPAALGVVAWTIILPRRAVADLSVDELRSLLAHELAHLARGDGAWLWINRCVCSLFAFQPLNQFARREWQRAAEFLCDSWAVHRTGSPLALARCLTEVASWRLPAQSPAASLAATGRKSGLVDRIERLLDARPQPESGAERRSNRRAVCYGGIGLVLLAWCAPRVDVVAASGNVQSRVVQEALGGAEPTEEITAVPEFARGATAEVVKPPASGESKFTEEGSDSQRSQKEVQGADGQASSEPQPELAGRGLPRMLLALDRDLAALEGELLEIEPLLRDTAGAPQPAKLADQLRGEINRLQQRRELLKARLKLFVR
jgi:beta-lactamase regulating signal transducer with metallopeptidase domain